MILTSTPFTRRRVLSAVALAPLAATAAPVDSFNPDDPRALLQGFRRLRFSLDPGPVFWWLRVSKHGVVDGALTHLYDMEICSIFQARDLEDGFSVTSLELIYTVDKQTGELVDELTNPYTGARLPWTHTPVGPATVNYFTSGMELPGELPGVKIEMTHGLTSGMMHAGQVWLKDDNAAVVTQLAKADAHGPATGQHDQPRRRGQGRRLRRASGPASRVDRTGTPRDSRRSGRSLAQQSLSV